MLSYLVTLVNGGKRTDLYKRQHLKILVAVLTQSICKIRRLFGTRVSSRKCGMRQRFEILRKIEKLSKFADC